VDIGDQNCPASYYGWPLSHLILASQGETRYKQLIGSKREIGMACDLWFKEQAAKQICPKCGAHSCVPIVYGPMGKRFREELDRDYGVKQWRGGGCFVEEIDPNCCCTVCETRFRAEFDDPWGFFKEPSQGTTQP
jgi:hypothetical protein